MAGIPDEDQPDFTGPRPYVSDTTPFDSRSVDEGPHEATPGSMGASQDLGPTQAAVEEQGQGYSQQPMPATPESSAPAPETSPFVVPQAVQAEQQALATPVAGAGARIGNTLRGGQRIWSDVIQPAGAAAVDAASQAAQGPTGFGEAFDPSKAIPMAHGLKIVQDTFSAFGAEAAKRVAAQLGIPDTELANILGHSVTTHDVIGAAAGALSDPTGWVGAGEVKPAAEAATQAVREAAPGVGASARLVGDLGNAVGGGVGGATIGAGLPADTPEERRRNALLGAGAGMLAGPAIGRMLPREGGALATFGASPSYKPPTPQQIAAAEAQGARRGEMLNRGVTAPESAVPRMVTAATKATDDRAGLRWAENVLTDAAGSPRMRENDPARPSTQSRVNSGSIANERIDNELAPAVVDAGRAGLQHELPQYLEDQHQLDILDDFYNRGHQQVMDERQPAIDDAKARGVAPAVIQRMETKAAADADRAGVARMNQRQGTSTSMTYPQIEARLQAQEARLKADGTWDQLQTSAQAVWDHNAQTRQRLVDAGEMDPTVAADLAQRYPHYVPTVPISHLNGGGSGVGRTVGIVDRGTRPVVSALEDVGTAGERLNPIVASRNSTITAERAIQRNTVAQAFAQMMDDALHADPKAMGVDPATHRTFMEGGVDVSYFENGKPVTLSVPKVVADGINAASNMGTDANGVTSVIKRVTRSFTSAVTAARASFVPVNVVRDATDYATQTMVREGNNPLHLPSIMATWADEAGRAAADILRAQANTRGASGAAIGAGLGAVQGDDQTTAQDRLIHAGEGAVAGTFLLGANRVGTTGKAAEYLARGGGEGAASASWKVGQRWYRDVMNQGGVPLKNPSDVLHYLGDWFGDVASFQGVKGINERAETIARTAAMRRADASGAAPVEAMIAGRNSSYDPDRAGTVVRAWNGFIPFLNATVQGGAQAKRMLWGDPSMSTAQHIARVAATTGAVTATLAPVMLATEYWNRSDPARAQAYDDVPQYIKDSGLVIMAPGQGGSDNRGQRPNYLWLPTEVLTPFIVAGRMAMQHADAVVPGMQPSAGRSDAGATFPGLPEEVRQPLGALNEALSVFYPVKGDSAASVASMVVPPIARQAIELGQNKDLFRGNAIQSAGQDERASGFGQAVARGANTVGRAVGSTTLQDVHPSQVDYLARQLPAYGDVITGASDMVKPSPYKATEQGRIANEPFVGGVAGRFDRDTGGANLERVQGQAMTPALQSAMVSARMRPSDVSLDVPSDYQNAPLTRSEQLRWQRAFRGALNEEVANVRDARAWEDPMTRPQAVKDAISKAKDRAAKDVLGLSASDIQDRTERAQRMQRRASGG